MEIWRTGPPGEMISARRDTLFFCFQFKTHCAMASVDRGDPEKWGAGGVDKDQVAIESGEGVHFRDNEGAAYTAGRAVVEINPQRIFSLYDVQRVIRIVFRITKSYSQRVDDLMEQLDALSGREEERAQAIEEEVNSLLQEWQAKISKLGALPKGLWIADFDSGDGYFCWKYPEKTIEHWHTYTDGFSKRVSVESRFRPVLFHDRVKRKILSFRPINLPAPEVAD